MQTLLCKFIILVNGSIHSYEPALVHPEPISRNLSQTDPIWDWFDDNSDQFIVKLESMETEECFYPPIDWLNYYDYNFSRFDSSSSDTFNQKKMFSRWC